MMVQACCVLHTLSKNFCLIILKCFSIIGINSSSQHLTDIISKWQFDNEIMTYNVFHTVNDATIKQPSKVNVLKKRNGISAVNCCKQLSNCWSVYNLYKGFKQNNDTVFSLLIWTMSCFKCVCFLEIQVNFNQIKDFLFSNNLTLWRFASRV